MNAGRYTIFLGIFRGRFLAGKIERDLRLRVTASRPAHQGIGAARFGLFKLQNPLISVGLARLHGGLRTLIDSCAHGYANNLAIAL